MFDLAVAGHKTFFGVLVKEIPPVLSIPYLARVKWDWERTIDGLPRMLSSEYDPPTFGYPGGLPDTNKTFYDQFFELVKKTQFLWFDLNCIAQYGKTSKSLSASQSKAAKQSWKSLTASGRFLTNGRSREEGYADYVLGVNLNSGKGGIQQENLVLGGNTVKVIGEREILGGRWYVPCAALDISKPLPAAGDLFRDKTLCHWCTNSTPFPVLSGGYRVDPFPQFGGAAVYVLIGKGGRVYIEERLLEPVEEIPSPFHR